MPTAPALALLSLKKRPPEKAPAFLLLQHIQLIHYNKLNLIVKEIIEAHVIMKLAPTLTVLALKYVVIFNGLYNNVFESLA